MGIQANEPKEYPKNGPAVLAVATGEIDVAFVNHYYLLRFLAEKGDTFPVRNATMANGDAGNLVNVAGAGVLKTSRRPAGAADLVAFLLDKEAQDHFAKETLEYPARKGVALDPALGASGVPDDGGVDLNRLADLEGTLKLLRECRVLR
jgi:iron(III) transport system substrate-binding protein